MTDLPAPMALPGHPGIELRPLRAADADALHAAVRASLPRLIGTLPWAHADYGPAEAAAWARHAEQAWATGTDHVLVLVDRASGALLGSTGLHHVVQPYRMASLGYWVATSHTGRGLARAAARRTAELAFGPLGFTRLEIVVLPHNHASQRVAEAVGATREGLARHRVYHQGRPHEAWVFGLIPADLASSG